MRDHTERSPEMLGLRAGEMTIAALAWGPPDGSLALCLHGYPDTAWTWRHLGPSLAARGWRVVAPYLRGYAPSGLAPDGGYALGALVRDVQHLRARLSADANAVLIGHDWGAAVAHIVAAGSEATFARVVTLAVPPPRAVLLALRRPARLPGLLPLAARQLQLSWYMGFNLIPGLSERALPRLIPWLWRHWSPGYDPREDLTAVRTALGSPERRAAALGYYRRLLFPRLWRTEDAAGLSGLFRAPRVPVLYLHGARDGCIDPRLTRLAGAVVPAGQIELLPEAGHFLHLEQPDQVAERIARFIES